MKRPAGVTVLACVYFLSAALLLNMLIVGPGGHFWSSLQYAGIVARLLLSSIIGVTIGVAPTNETLVPLVSHPTQLRRRHADAFGFKHVGSHSSFPNRCRAGPSALRLDDLVFDSAARENRVSKRLIPLATKSS